jgi:hypothetical protein
MKKEGFPIVVLSILLIAPSAYAANLSDNGNGTVTDSDSGLIWQKEDDDTGRTWQGTLDDDKARMDFIYQGRSQIDTAAGR